MIIEQRREPMNEPYKRVTSEVDASMYRVVAEQHSYATLPHVTVTTKDADEPITLRFTRYDLDRMSDTLAMVES
jgi:hypothetical protein